MTWLWVSVGAIVGCFSIVTFCIKGFWKDLFKDFLAIATRHWLKIFGYLVQFALPITLLAVAYFSKYEKTGVKVSVIVWLVAIPLLLIWWGKMRKAVSDYLVRIKAVNEVVKGRHMALIGIFSFFRDLVMPFATAIALWFLVYLSGKVMGKAENGLMIFALCIGIGGMMIFIDTSINAASMPQAFEISRDGRLSQKK